MKTVTAIVFVIMFLGILGLIVARNLGPGGDGVLARLTLADGSEYLLTQQHNVSWTEPYTVSFWLRPRGGEWGWCYVDHEALRWSESQLQYDEARQSVQVLHQSDLRGELDLKSHTFTLFGSTERTVAAPQELRTPPTFDD